MILLLVTLSLWLAFVIWLWVGLVRTAWKWGSHKLGTPIFKYLQIGFFVVTVFTALHRSDLRENLNILSLVLLGFDVAIVIMIFNFLLLAWFARCKIPFRAYGQIGSIVLMIVIQVWVFLQTSRS